VLSRTVLSRTVLSRTVPARIAVGRERVAREVRAAGPLAARLRAPVTARGPWLTTVLNTGAARFPPARPVAVVVEAAALGRPEAVAVLRLRRRGPVTEVTLLGSDARPLPGGRPAHRLLAGDQGAADLLAGGIIELLGSLRGPCSVRLAGLPLGDPTVAALAARLPTALLATERSTRLVDALDEVGAPQRSRDPVVLERWLPALLAAADPPSRAFLRAAARLHSSIGQLETAVVVDRGQLRAGLLTLVDGAHRWPWWGASPGGGPPGGGLRTEMGAPLVSLTVPARRWPR
jgi:hypothetical protein